MANEKLDLIDRNAFIEDIKTEIMNLYLDGLKGTPRPRSELYDIIDRINEQPTVDAVEVVHGRWIEKEYCEPFGGYYLFHCSECDAPNARERNYCPNCGADMRGETE